jgi:hypothetical protein
MRAPRWPGDARAAIARECGVRDRHRRADRPPRDRRQPLAPVSRARVDAPGRLRAEHPRAYYYLRCGTGHRHILDRHRADFERLAFGTFQNWRDIADLAMDAISRDPDAATPAGAGKGCLSRVIFLTSLRTNQPVRQQVIRMIIRLRDNAIISAFPGFQCG